MSALFAVVAAVGVSVFGVGGAADAATVVSMITNVRDAKCVVAEPGTNAVVQEPCVGNVWGQTWTNVGLNLENAPGQIVNFSTGLCMDISSFADGARVVLVPCAGQPVGSYWTYTRVGRFDNGTVKYTLKSAFTNYCLDLENGLRDNGLPLQVWTCNSNTDNQRWYNQVSVV